MCLLWLDIKLGNAGFLYRAKVGILMTESSVDEESPAIDDATTKEMIINAYLVDSGLSKSEISELVDCSYEYARQVINKIKNGEVDADKFEKEKLKQHFLKQLDRERQQVKLTNSEDTNIDPPDKSRSEPVSGTIPAAELQRVIDMIDVLRREAEYEIKQGRKQSREKYFVANEAIELLNDLVERADNND